MGDSLASLRFAASQLPVVARSSVYRTEPQGEVLDQPDFLNAAVEIETSLSPEELLRVCKGLEQEAGRVNNERHGPRVLDVDLLLLGDLVVETDRLTLPHRDVLVRRFVLVPLLELDPDLTLPDGGRLDDALARLEGQRVERVGVL